MSRPSKVQPAVIELLERFHSLTATQITDELSRSQGPLNKTSVYRVLEHLLEQGVLCRQNFSEDITVYELRDHHHDHLVCEQCGNVEVASCLAKIPQKIGEFIVGHHHLTIYGVCQACQIRMQ